MNPALPLREAFAHAVRPYSRPKLCLTAAVFALACAPLARAAKETPVPDWVLQAATAAPLKPEWRDAKAVYLLEDTLITVQPDGHVVHRYRAVVKILRPQGRDYAIPVASFPQRRASCNPSMSGPSVPTATTTP